MMPVFWLQLAAAHPKLINDTLDIIVTFGPTAGSFTAVCTVGWKLYDYIKKTFGEFLEGLADVRKALIDHNTLDMERFEQIREQINEKRDELSDKISGIATDVGILKALRQADHERREDA